jgi:hypothetical protein
LNSIKAAAAYDIFVMVLGQQIGNEYRSFVKQKIPLLALRTASTDEQRPDY